MEENPNPFSKSEMLYLSLAAFFCTIVVVANLITVKLISLPLLKEYAIPAGLLIYPITFLVGDLVTEIFGSRRAKFMVYLGFAIGIISHGMFVMAIHLKPHPEWVSSYNPYGFSSSAEFQNAFSAVFGMNGIALMSSIAAYSVAQILDIKLFSFLKEMTYGRFLWLRNIGSTLTSQMMDTLIVNTLLLYCGLKLDLHTVMHISLVCYVYKIIFTLSNAPIFYLLVALCKKFLGSEYVDPEPQLLTCELKPNTSTTQ